MDHGTIGPRAWPVCGPVKADVRAASERSPATSIVRRSSWDAYAHGSAAGTGTRPTNELGRHPVPAARGRPPGGVPSASRRRIIASAGDRDHQPGWPRRGHRCDTPGCARGSISGLFVMTPRSERCDKKSPSVFRGNRRRMPTVIACGPAFEIGPDLADPAVQVVQRPGVVDHDVGDRQPLLRGSPGRPSGPGACSRHAAQPDQPGEPHLGRHVHHDHHVVAGRRGSPPAAARRARRRRRRARLRRLLGSAIRSPTSGCTIALSARQRCGVGEHDARPAAPGRASRRGGARRRRSAATTCASPGVPGATTSRAITSASITTAPLLRQPPGTSLLPDPMPPVSPTLSTATCLS